MKKFNDLKFGTLNLDKILSISYVLWACSPLLIRNFQIAGSILAVLWMITAFLSTKKINKKLFYSISLILINYFFVIVYKLTDYSSALIGNYYVYFLNWFPMIIYLYYINNKDLYFLKCLGNIYFFSFFTNILDNVRLLNLYPDASGEINFESGTMFLDMNVGTTMFIGASLIFGLISLILFLDLKKNKIYYFLGLVLSVIYIYITDRLTTIFLIIVGAGLLFFIELTKPLKKKDKFIIRIILILLFFFSIVIFISLIKYEESFSARTEYMKVSLSTWTSNLKVFLFGIGWHKGTGETAIYNIGIGQHSEFIDLFAKYGVIGVLLTASILYRFFKVVLSNVTNNKLKNQSKIIMLIYCIYSVMNNSFSIELGTITFLIMPIMQYMIMEKDLNF